MREVLEAVEVGMEMGGGPATVSARFALEVMASVLRGRRRDGEGATMPGGLARIVRPKDCNLRVGLLVSEGVRER